MLQHPILGNLEQDEYETFRGKTTLEFAGKSIDAKMKFELDEGYEDEDWQRHGQTYQKFLENLDKLTPDILQAILEYQHEHYKDNDHTAGFKYFETENDVLENTELYELAFLTQHFGIVEESEKQQQAKMDSDGLDRCLVLVFGADWVSDDYRLLSVALTNETVVYVTEASISD